MNETAPPDPSRNSDGAHRIGAAILLLASLACSGDGSATDAGAADAIPSPSGTCSVSGVGPLPAEPTGCAASTPLVCPVAARECPLVFVGAQQSDLTGACGVYCGDGAIALRNGCVAEVDMRLVGTVDGRPEAEAKECVRQRLVGTRWNCALGDGWWKVSVAACMLP